MSKPPQISVIMSVYNGEKYLCEAIESILNQTFYDFEFIIIDDGSSDKTAKIINSYNDSRIKFFSQSNHGLVYSLNFAINLAEGVYVARMDADDISLPTRLEKQYLFMKENPDCVALGVNAMIIDKDGVELFTTTYQSFNESNTLNIRDNNPLIHGSVVLEKSSLEKAGGYNSRIKHFIEDDLLWLDLFKLGRICVLEEVLYKYRIVPSSISKQVSGKSGKKLNKISNEYYISGKLSEESIRYINSLVGRKNSKKLESQYYCYVGKIHFEYKNNIPLGKQYFQKAIKLNLLNYKAYFNLFLTYLNYNSAIIIKKMMKKSKLLISLIRNI